MTREEIIKGLKIATRKIGGCYDDGGWLDNDETLARKSCEEAIKLLEQESCEDCTSRQAVIEYIEGSSAELGHSSENELVCQYIRELPPVTLKPCEERKQGKCPFYAI